MAALLRMKDPQAELGLAISLAAGLQPLAAADAAHPPPALAKRCDHSRGSRESFGQQRQESRVICELQHKVGPGGGREEEAELERRDSNEEKGKTKTKAKPNRQTRGSYWQRRGPCTGRARGAGVARSWGRWGTGLEPTCLRPAPPEYRPALVPPMDPQIRDREHKVLQAPVQGFPSATLPWGLRRGQARQMSPEGHPSLAEGSPSLPEPLCSLGQLWGTGNPGTAACMHGSWPRPW